MAGRHYEQPGSLAGTILVGDERLSLAGAGMRDHSWGVRDWQSVPYWRWFGMVVDPDNFVMLNNVGTADGGESVGGCLMQTAGWRRSRAATRSRSWTRISAASAASPPAPGTSWAATSSYAARR